MVRVDDPTGTSASKDSGMGRSDARTCPVRGLTSENSSSTKKTVEPEATSIGAAAYGVRGLTTGCTQGAPVATRVAVMGPGWPISSTARR
jgi:hypothetical protein